MPARSTPLRSRKKPKKTQHKKAAKSDAEQMAAHYIQARTALVRAGRALHDDVGSPLTAAGVQLQLLRMDLPDARIQIDETLRILEAALDRVRSISQDLCPSPAYRGGLKQALLRLADQHASSTCHIDVYYSSAATVPGEIAAAIHETATAAVEKAVFEGASHVGITVRGADNLVVRIADDGRKSGRERALGAAALLAREQGLKFECGAGNGTIIIRYALRRTPGG
jgi:signal transduction histidine kinase